MKNKRLALKLLANDCQLIGFYVSKAKTCAVGCLALASGVSKNQLALWNGRVITAYELDSVRSIIYEKFALNDRDLDRIQEANDGEDSLLARRKAVLKVVRSIKA